MIAFSPHSITYSQLKAIEHSSLMLVTAIVRRVLHTFQGWSDFASYWIRMTVVKATFLRFALANHF